MRNPQSCPQCGQRNNAVGIFLFPPFPPFLSLSRHLRGNFQYGKICNVHAMCSGVKQCYYTTAPCFTALLVHLIERKRILALNKKCKKKKKQRRLSALKKKKHSDSSKIYSWFQIRLTSETRFDQSNPIYCSFFLFKCFSEQFVTKTTLLNKYQHEGRSSEKTTWAWINKWNFSATHNPSCCRCFHPINVSGLMSFLYQHEFFNRSSVGIPKCLTLYKNPFSSAFKKPNHIFKQFQIQFDVFTVHIFYRYAPWHFVWEWNQICPAM